MMKAIVVAAAMGLLPSIAHTREAGKLERLMEDVCIGGHLNEELLGPMVEAAASFYKMTAKELAVSDLRLVNPDTTSGWGLHDADETFIVSFARKPANTGTSRSCTVGTKSSDAAAIREFIEEKFKSRKIIDESQGSSSIVVYVLDLIGFERPLFLSIQTSKSTDPRLQMTSVSIYDDPSP